MKWINVKERLPKKFEPLLLLCNHHPYSVRKEKEMITGFYKLGLHDGKQFFCNDDYTACRDWPLPVIYWISIYDIPAPTKPEDKE
jgi:hypothetical protein